MARTPTPPNTKNEERESSRQLSALKALVPFLYPYRVLVAAAMAASTPSWNSL